MIGPEPALVAKTSGKLAIAAYGAWKNRQQDRLIKRLIVKISNLESRLNALPIGLQEDADAVIGKSIAVAFQDAREWKLSILASILNKTLLEEQNAQLSEALVSMCDKLEPRHVVILRILINTDCDSTSGKSEDKSFTMSSYNLIKTQVEVSGEVDMALFWMSMNELVQLGLLTSRWKSVNDYSSLLTGISMVALLMNQAFKPTSLCVKLIDHIENISL